MYPSSEVASMEGRLDGGGARHKLRADELGGRLTSSGAPTARSGTQRSRLRAAQARDIHRVAEAPPAQNGLHQPLSGQARAKLGRVQTLRVCRAPGLMLPSAFSKRARVDRIEADLVDQLRHDLLRLLVIR